MTEHEKNLNALLVDVVNTIFAKEGLCRPKRENNRNFKIGRRHRVKYHKVILKHSREVKYSFRVGDIKVYVELENWPPVEDSKILALNKYILRVIKLEPLSDSVGYITVEDFNYIGD